MEFRSLLITGGAGFVGSNLAMMFKIAFPDVPVYAVDNLKRRGSELRVSMLQATGIEFLHADVRCPEDLAVLPEFDLLIDCSAEASVQAGVNGSPLYVINTNIAGTVNCLEMARLRNAAVMFLSTSRVYPIAMLNALPFQEDKLRFRWKANPEISGFSEHGIAEAFPLTGARSFYGATKLASELLLQEYVYNYKMKGIVNRCGILTGPWQMGKVDQGVSALWVSRHYFKKPLKYIGFGGQGKQVRDLLHIEDLFDLLVAQTESASCWDGRVYNVGGGVDVSVSLLELTALCESVTGNKIDITAVPRTSDVDLRIYVTDSRSVQNDFGWCPRRSARQIVEDIYHWIDEHVNMLEPILG